MKVYVMPRGSGKTTALIEESNKTQIPILVSDSRRANDIEYMAKDLGLDIPEPIVVGRTRGVINTSVLVDDLDSVIGVMFRRFGYDPKIATMSIGGEIDILVRS